MTATTDIGQKLWTLCDSLRDDGITYLQYVTELTYLLFLKMMQETENDHQLPEGYRWADLVGKNGVEQLEFYRSLLLHLGSKDSSKRVQSIFANAQTALKQPRILKKLVQSMDEIDWYSAKREGLGDLYENLLEKNASEKKSGAGQYFTPRPLIDSMVALIQPQVGELVQDPAAGTGGFLIAADRFVKEQTDELYDLPQELQDFQRQQAFYGIELVQDAHRLLLMNLMLHGIEGDVALGDTLSSDGQRLKRANVILTNPPFGTKKGGGLPSRDDFTYATSNKQLAFLQHIYRSLKPGGRAAVVLPDNVLFEDKQGRSIRADLMDKCNLHTILRLPTGIFYAQGVKTNVLFFQRGTTEKGNTQSVWIYDMRTNMPSFGKRIPLTRDHFQEFEQCYGTDPNGQSERIDQGETGRFRCFTREAIAKRGDNLDISWLRDESLQSDELQEPEVIAAEILERLQVATKEMEALMVLLEGEEAAEAVTASVGLPLL
ncbi:N-6 DNA methylase [Leptolyngbya boryana NIES-2135]|jgi:type I restriction enzyme M protein|uniref:site-specific DNA-methyltransferase (adenine-specific) n=1 Tax=Leptolyngbya boryana NIES-2135 TaxID=1973484 RepID=A0A1Z4JGZ7_LEPBY|nr:MULTISPECIES: N-6 DNA methylase [Leptolyngbya]BAY55797.1 N-6 DNA methylase [Leptolyngbya boryana NIES-2135]MBD2368898.1 N-6 DNA methylase [Leptolyngbya sp. FACHB-161]MBD2375234.1 N-6 DNA methylase [Leptolyngbya sp. FACHB-238]MBD2399652.1 N-6 DNA methylase [Leptolyngbya sp. FACHB-239]MBD2405858.1 N-6 DNA methylase [Leptolyngbya sp. FACHB-402]